MKTMVKRAQWPCIVCLSVSIGAWAQSNIGVALDTNYPYPREYMTMTEARGKTVLVIALGSLGSTLFGVQYDGAYGHFVTSTDNGSNWTDTGSSLPTFSGSMLGMIFQSNYAFVYTDSGLIFR